MLMKKTAWLALILLLFTVLDLACGTLGGFDEINFPTSKENLERAIDSLYSSHPEYKIPPEWETYNDWSKRGYDFLESRIFYFQLPPNEMYYVSFIGDSAMLADTTQILISIRAVNKGTDYWYLRSDLDSREQQRIQARFNNEIVSKLELYTNSKSRKDD